MRTLALVIGIVLLFTVGSLSALLMVPGSRTTLTVFEIGRLLKHLPVSANIVGVTITRQGEAPPQGADASSQAIRRAVAAELQRPLVDVRVQAQQPPQLTAAILNEEKLYAPSGRFDPRLYGLFVVGARDAQGRWQVVARQGGKPDAEWRGSFLLWTFGWLALTIPLGVWFSRQLTRSIRRFSAAAERVGNGETIEIPMEGATEIRLAAKSVNAMQQRIARYVDERSSMVGAIAHDLRAPLSRLNFHLAEAPEALREKAQRNIEEMEQMIRSILDFVHGELDQHPREPTDLGLLVEGVVDNVRDGGKNVRLHTASETIVNGAPVLLSRLVMNLVDNSLKYGSDVEVSVSTNGQWCTIDIDDSGPGMSETDIARAFQPFFRVEPSRNHATGGVGLGLAIAESAARFHGGSVTLSNLQPHGLRARVILPVIEG